MNIFRERFRNLWMYLLLVMAIGGFVAVAHGSNIGFATGLSVNLICGLTVAGVLLYFWKGKIGVQVLLGLYVILLATAPVYWLFKYGTLLDIRLGVSLVGNVAVIFELVNALRVESILQARMHESG
jgi:hypothetical protein